MSSVDVPLLEPAFVRAVVAASVRRGSTWPCPSSTVAASHLAAAFRVSVRGVVAELLSEDRLALGALVDRCRRGSSTGAELPAPRSLTNLNEPADYERRR